MKKQTINRKHEGWREIKHKPHHTTFTYNMHFKVRVVGLELNIQHKQPYIHHIWRTWSCGTLRLSLHPRTSNLF